MLRSRLKQILFVAGLGLAVLGARCEAPDLLEPDRNRPPETRLTRAPDSLDVTYFRVHLFWSGFDPDGTVSEWQFAIDDTVIRPDAEIVGTGWIRTTKTDTMLVLSASENGTDQQRPHRFFLASIDNEGKPDPTPSVLDLVARTICYPVPTVTEGPAEGETLDVFSDVRLVWGGDDCDGRIVKMAYQLDPFEAGFKTVRFPDTTSIVYRQLPSNRSREAYKFLLIAEDDAGSRNLVPVVRQFVVNHDPNTTVTRFYSRHASGNPLLVDPDIAPGDTIADSSRVTFIWESSDVDGDIAGAFWAIEGRGNIRSDEGLASMPQARQATVPSDQDLIAAEEPPFPRPPWILSDIAGLRLIVGSFDSYGRAEGSPDTIPFFCNFPPSVSIVSPATTEVSAPNFRMRVQWQGGDRDGPVSRIEYDVAVTRRGGVEQPIQIEAGQPAFRDFDVTTGNYNISVTPTDRNGDGKTGATVSRSVFVTAGGAIVPNETEKGAIDE
jgi:hypothetical protein